MRFGMARAPQRKTADTRRGGGRGGVYVAVRPTRSNGACVHDFSSDAAWYFHRRFFTACQHPIHTHTPH